VIAADTLRPPSDLDPSAGAYKDWLHLNVFDHAGGAVGLVNASLHGAPADPRSRAVGAALFHVPDRGWAGNLEVLGIDEANLGARSIGLERVALAVDAGNGDVLAAAHLPEDGLEVDVRGRQEGPGHRIELPVPLEPGWISWSVAPVLRLSGRITVGGADLDLDRATGYHDHNWGRWQWGDDVGWEWGCFQAPDGPAFVVSRTTDRDHRRTGPPHLLAVVGRHRRSWTGARVEVEIGGVLDARLRRLPGAMAALHQDRARPRLPDRVAVRATDGEDRVALEFHARAAAQLIAADPTGRGFGFIHELVGTFSARWAFAGAAGSCAGLGIFEHVD
jgi:hypothetical protein